MVKPKYPIEQYKYCSKCKLKFPEDNKAWCVCRHRQPAPLQYCRDFMKDTSKELYDLIKGMEKIKEINNFISYVCI